MSDFWYGLKRGCAEFWRGTLVVLVIGVMMTTGAIWPEVMSVVLLVAFVALVVSWTLFAIADYGREQRQFDERHAEREAKKLTSPDGTAEIRLPASTSPDEVGRISEALGWWPNE